MANPGDFAYTVKEQADIVRIVGEYVKLRKSGAQNFQGLCPFHQEKTPSFSVHATRQFFHCFGCGASGDVFAFVQKIENITFPEAVRLVAEKLKIPLPKMTYSSPEEARRRQAARRPDRHPRARLRVFPGAVAPSRSRACPRVSCLARTHAGDTLPSFASAMRPIHGFLLRDALRGQFDEELLRESGLFSWKEKEQLSVASGQLSEEPER